MAHRRRLVLLAVLGFASLSANARAVPQAVEAAGVALRTGNASNAVSLATQALAAPDITTRDRARVLADRGLAYEQLKQFDAAVADLTEAIGASVLPPSEQAHALYDRGVTFDETGRTQDAATDYGAAIAIDPRFAMALNNRANAYRRLGRLKEAQLDYMAAIAAGGHLEYPNFGLGLIAESEHRLDDARNYYRTAIAADPQFTLAFDRLRVLGGDLADAHPMPVQLRQPPTRTASAVRPASPVSAPTSPASPPSSNEPPPSVTGPTVTSSPRENSAPHAAASAPRAGGTSTVQLGAWRSEAEALAALTRILAQSSDVLAGVKPDVVAVDLAGRGRFYRLRAAVNDGAGVCAALAARRLGCMLTRD